MKIMKMTKLLMIPAVAVVFMTSCKTSRTVKTADNNMLMNGQVTNEEIAADNMYSYPLADTVMKYSSTGMVGEALTDKMTAYAKELQKNLGDEASVMQFGEGIVVALDKGDMFNLESPMLTEKTKTVLRKFAYNVKEGPDVYILVAGRTDATGSSDYNELLAKKRASVAATYLNGCGVAKEKFFIDSFGENYPDYSNKTRANRDKNRRVDFLLIPSNSMREEMAAK